MSPVSPIIKWPGGKRQLLSSIIPRLPSSFHRYFEPFFGGGALFCSVQPKEAVINDSNPQLMHLYCVLKKKPEFVASLLFQLQKAYNSWPSMEAKDEFYFDLRSQFNAFIASGRMEDSTAALLVFLNKTGFNGLYCVNRSGKYNVPSAHKNRVNTYDESNLSAFSHLLSHAQILCGDFQSACESASDSDFIFFDPPYFDTFDSYRPGRFNEQEHIRLFLLFELLTAKGVYCMLTNSNTDFIKSLYCKYRIAVVDAKRMINRDAAHRVGKEVIITNY